MYNPVSALGWLLNKGRVKKTSPSTNRFVLYDENALAGMPAKRISALESEAKILLDAPLLSVADKEILPHGASRNDYVSASTYDWPDESGPWKTPDARRDGHTNPDIWNPKRFDRRRLSGLSYSASALALAYHLTKNEGYAKKASEFLHAWFVDGRSRMNPSLEFGQMIRGKGDCIGIIDTVDLIPITDAVRMLEGSGRFEREREPVMQWFGDYAHWLKTSQKGRAESNMRNNHAVWYGAQLAVFSRFVGDGPAARSIIESAPVWRIASQINPDGKIPRELARTRPMHYSIFIIEAFIVLASEAEKYGIDLWNYESRDGRGIRKAVDFILPYHKGEKAWEYPDLTPEKEVFFDGFLELAARRYPESRFMPETAPALPVRISAK